MVNNRDLGGLDATGIAKLVRTGSILARDVCEHFLDVIAKREPSLHALANFDPGAMRLAADAIDRQPVKGAMAGVPIGIKDVFDTVDLPTEFFSKIYKDNRPSRDAFTVAALRASGAIVAGKSATAEFAYMHTGPTVNPHDTTRTPGSSSAGSAAGLAGGLFAASIGTQTAGSILKPAAYCGVYGYKPTKGLVSLEGVKPLAPSFDTVGWLSRSARDLALIGRTLLPGFSESAPELKVLKIGIVAAAHPQLDVDVEDAITRAIEIIRRAGHSVSTVRLPPQFDEIKRHHATINDREGARSLQIEFANRRVDLSPEVIAMFDRAGQITLDEELNARDALIQLYFDIEPLLGKFDVLISPTCPTVAPIGLTKTGSSDLIKCWTALGLPQGNIPLTGLRTKLPVGLQAIGRPFRDGPLLSAITTLASTLGKEDCASL